MTNERINGRGIMEGIEIGKTEEEEEEEKRRKRKILQVRRKSRKIPKNMYIEKSQLVRDSSLTHFFSLSLFILSASVTLPTKYVFQLNISLS